MCGIGASTDEKLTIYLGYYGCTMSIKDEVYNPQDCKWYKESVDKETFIEKIKKLYTYDEFINAVLECIENGGEY